MAINIYSKNHTAERLRDYLMGEVKVGDADELHNALIVLCGIVDSQQKQIADLNRSIQLIYKVIKPSVSITTKKES